MPPAGTPNCGVRTGVVSMVKSTLVNVCRECFSLLGPVLPMMLPSASSSYMLSIDCDLIRAIAQCHFARLQDVDRHAARVERSRGGEGGDAEATAGVAALRRCRAAWRGRWRRWRRWRWRWRLEVATAEEGAGGGGAGGGGMGGGGWGRGIGGDGEVGVAGMAAVAVEAAGEGRGTAEAGKAVGATGVAR